MYEDIIEECSLFQGVSKHFKQQILSEHQIKTVSVGTRVVQQGDPSDGMYLVLQGKLTVSVRQSNPNDPEKKIATLSRAHYFGEICMISESNRTASVDTQVDSTLMCIRRDAFQQVIANRDPDGLLIVYNIANLLVHRLTQTNQLVAQLASQGPQSSELSRVREKLLAIEIL